MAGSTFPLERQLLLASLASVIALALPAGSLAQVGPCTDGDLLLGEKQLEAAKGTYLALLAETPSLPCAHSGLERAIQEQGVARSHFNLGLVYRGLSELDRARVELAQAISLDASLAEAANALANLSLPPSADAVEVPDGKPESLKLAEYGLQEAAIASLQEEIEGGEEIRDRRLLSLADQRLPWWRQALLDWAPWARTLGEVTLVLSLAGLVVLRPLLRRLLLPTLTISPFEGASVNTNVGESLATLVKNQLHDQAATTTRSLDLISGEIQAQALPSEIGIALPLHANWMAALPALLNWISPRSRVLVSGSLHPDGGRGPGITLHLVRDQHLVTSQSFWLHELEPPTSPDTPGDHYSLGRWMAAWLIFNVPRRGGSKCISILGTEDWRSYALFRKGCEADGARNTKAAKGAYRGALDRDFLMRGAKLNLGRILSREWGPDQATEPLQHAHELLAQAEEEAADERRDPTSYGASYSHAVVILKSASVAQDPAARIAEAFAKAKHLKRRVEKAREPAIKRLWLRLVDPPLADYLKSIEPEAHGLYAGLAAIVNDREGIEWALRQLRPFYLGGSLRARWTPRGQYNIACALSLLAQYDRFPSPHEQELAEQMALKLLTFALRGDVSLRENFFDERRALKDPSLDHLYGRYQGRLDRLMDELDPPPPPAPKPDPPSGVEAYLRAAFPLIFG